MPYICSESVTTILYLATPLTIEEKDLSGLPYDIWFPFEMTVTRYWIFYAWQCFMIITTIASNLFIDYIIYAFVFSGCFQFDILYSRFQKSIDDLQLSSEPKAEKIKTEKKMIENAVEHHVAILK